jgi:putative ABC transport system permease protein
MLFQFVIRNLRRYPFLNFIKILGLALGLSGILFIILFLKNELTYDSYHNNAERIYRFTVTDPTFLGNNHFARIIKSEQIPALAAYFPEIESYVRLSEIRGGVMKHGEQYYSITEAFECDSTFFQVFDAELLVGEKNSVLENPASMVVSESFARKVFGATNPVGLTISVPAGQYYGEQSDYSVKGVMKDFPQNSHFHPDLVATPARGPIQWWAYTYLLLSKNANPENIANGYKQFLEKESGDPNQKFKPKA